MLNSSDVCDYPLAAAVCLADDPLADEILKLASELIIINLPSAGVFNWTNNHKIYKKMNDY